MVVHRVRVSDAESVRLSSTVERWIGQGGASTPAASTVTSASSSASIADPSASTSYSVPPEARVQTEAGAVAFVTLGQRLARAPIELRSTRSRPGAPPSGALIEIEIAESAVDVLDASNKVGKRGPESAGGYTVSLAWKEGKWRVAGIAESASP